MANENLNVVVSLVDRASAGLTGMSRSLKRFGEAATAASKKFTLAMGAMVIGVGFAVKQFADFEQQMSKVKAITDATGDDFKKLNDLAKKMGRTTVFTATEAGEAMQFLGMAGFESSEIMDSLAHVLDLASAGSISLGEAADVSTNIMTGFGLEAKDMNRVVDVMAAAAASSNTNITELGEAMKFLAPTAATMGIPLEEATAAIGLLGNAALKGGIATRQLQSSLLRLAAPTPKMSAKMDELDLDFFDSEGDFVGLIGTIRQVEESFEDLTQEQRLNAIGTIFGAGAAKQFATLLAKGSDELERYTRVLELSEGAARKMATTMLDNLAGSWTLAKSALSGLMIEIGSKFSPVLRDILGNVTDLANNVTDFLQDGERLNEFFEENKDMIEIVAAAIVGMMIPAVVSLGVAFGGLILTLAPFAAIGIAVFKAWETNFLGMKDKITTAIEYMRENFDGFRDKVVEVFETVIEWININIIPTIIKLKEYWDENFLGMRTTVTTIFKAMIGLVQIAWDALVNIIELGLAILRGDWSKAWEEIQAIFGNVWDTMTIILTSAVDVMKGIIRGFIEMLVGAINKVKEFVGLSTDISYNPESSVDRGFAAVGSFLGFEKGGIVPKFAGGGIAGDTVPAMLTPGEVILNAAQQKNLAGGLGGVTINISGVFGSDAAEEIGDLIVDKLNMHSAT